MGWSLSDMGIAGFTLVGVVPALIIIGALFLFGGLALYFAGLMSAMLYFLAGVGVLWFLKLFGVFNHAWGYLFLLILPVAALVGWGVDNLTFLSMLPNPGTWLALEPEIVLSTNDLTGDVTSFIFNFQNFGGIMSTVGAVVGVATIYLTRKRGRKHR
jgi:hypothetical protein